jgi:cardiolipin synthase
MEYLEEAGMPLTEGNDVRLLKSGHEKFDALFEDIRNARRSVH